MITEFKSAAYNKNSTIFEELQQRKKEAAPMRQPLLVLLFLLQNEFYRDSKRNADTLSPLLAWFPIRK